MSERMSDNQREVLSGQSTLSMSAEYLRSTGGKLNVLVANFSPDQSVYVDGTTAAITDTADHLVIAAPATGYHLRITSMLITNGHSSTGTYVVVKDGSTEKKRAFTAFGGGGAMLIFPNPLKLSSATALNVANITNASETYVSAEGYTEAD